MECGGHQKLCNSCVLNTFESGINYASRSSFARRKQKAGVFARTLRKEEGKRMLPKPFWCLSVSDKSNLCSKERIHTSEQSLLNNQKLLLVVLGCSKDFALSALSRTKINREQNLMVGCTGGVKSILWSKISG